MRLTKVLFLLAGSALSIGCACCSSFGGDQSAPETGSSARDLATFEARLASTLTPQSAELLFGKPDRVEGSGLIIYVYRLDDGQEIWMGFPGFEPILYAKLRAPDGQMRDLALK